MTCVAEVKVAQRLGKHCTSHETPTHVSAGAKADGQAHSITANWYWVLGTEEVVSRRLIDAIFGHHMERLHAYHILVQPFWMWSISYLHCMYKQTCMNGGKQGAV